MRELHTEANVKIHKLFLEGNSEMSEIMFLSMKKRKGPFFW